jgi:hypothetical protein
LPDQADASSPDELESRFLRLSSSSPFPEGETSLEEARSILQNVDVLGEADPNTDSEEQDGEDESPDMPDILVIGGPSIAELGIAPPSDSSPDRPDGAAPSNASPHSGSDDGGLQEGYIPHRTYDLLPKILRYCTNTVKGRRKRDIFLTGALPVCAAALSPIRFHYGNSRLSPNLYTLVVAPPASGKSALRHARQLGDDLRKTLAKGSIITKKQLWSDEPELLERKISWEKGPPLDRLFLAADSSPSALKQRLSKSPHGIIFETELPSLRGGFDDILLKGFQNEPVEVDRKTGGRTSIPHPAPSVALSGTPSSLSSLFKGTRNGLYCRFLPYRFQADMKWASQFERKEGRLNRLMRDAGKGFSLAHVALRERSTPLEISVPSSLQEMHTDTFDAIMAAWQKNQVRSSLLPLLLRSGLQAVKIAVVLRAADPVLEEVETLGRAEALDLRPCDMEAGVRLALTYLLHAVRTEPEVYPNEDTAAVRNLQQRQYLEALPNEPFTTQEAKAIADRQGVNSRTAQRWLSTWAEEGLLAKPKHGEWDKQTPATVDEAAVEGILASARSIPEIGTRR